MTRQIAAAILLTVWAMLIAGGVVAYFTTRSVLLADLDATLMSNALSQAVQTRVPTTEPTAEPSQVYLGGNRYLVKNDLKQTIARPGVELPEFQPQLVDPHFSDADGKRLRTVLVRYYVIPPRGAPQELMVPYSGSADQFDALMNRLALSLTFFGVIGGLVTAAVAVRVSKSALRPLNSTAQQIGVIDEQKLDRRIDTGALPPELKPMAQRLNEMLARLQEAFSLRNQFIGDASHELRTPVAALVTTLDVALRHPRDGEAYRRILESCRGDARQLKHLVERLMEQIRSQSLTHDEPAQHIDAATLLRACIASVAPLAEVKEVTIVNRFPDQLPCTLVPGRMRSIIVNLLSNAIEYDNRGGEVELAASCDAAGLHVRVTDTGIGIAPEHLPRLFEPFYRADKARSHDAGHLGLGLSLVQAHAQAMSGVCRVESELGHGTTFFVDVPPCKAAVPAPPETGHHQDSTDKAAPKPVEMSNALEV